jgi:hypothetical protein
MARAYLLLVIVGACGGAQIPAHNGYKTEKAKPWKKAKNLKFDEKNEAKAEGDLSYPDMRRAAWYGVDLGTPAELDLRVEITPPGDATNDDFDLALEVLDPGFRVISKSDLEDEDAHELNKTKALLDLAPGHYMVHMYLQGRMDTAEYILHATLKPTSASVGKSDFPAQVATLPALPMVPLNDDTPKTYHPPVAVVTHTNHKPKGDPKPKDPVPPPVAAMTGRIIGMNVVSGGTQITIGRGTSNGAAVGMKGKIPGVPSGSFTLAACNERTCTAVVAATPDQIKGAGSVTLGQ